MKNKKNNSKKIKLKKSDFAKYKSEIDEIKQIYDELVKDEQIQRYLQENYEMKDRDVVDKMFPKEEIIDTCDKWNDDLQKEVFKLTKECNRRESNWKELKKWMNSEMKRFEDNPYTRLTIAVFTKVLDRMQELENGKND